MLGSSEVRMNSEADGRADLGALSIAFCSGVFDLDWYQECEVTDLRDFDFDLDYESIDLCLAF